jgi:hypothetical protein
VFSEYPDSAAVVTFANPGAASYSGSAFVAPTGVTADTTESFSVTIPSAPECKGQFELQLLADKTFVTVTEIQRGLKGNLYRLPSSTKRLPDFSVLTPEGQVYIDALNVPVRSFLDGFPGVASDLVEWFAIDFYADLVIETAGTYEFRLTSDDGSVMYLGESVIINNDGVHAVQSVNSAPVQLAKGANPIRISYFQGPKQQIALQLLYKGPGVTTWTIVPQTMLRVRP